MKSQDWSRKSSIYKFQFVKSAAQILRRNKKRIAFLRKSNNSHRKPAEILWFQRVSWSEWLVSNQRPRGPKQEPKTFFGRFQWFFIISARIPLLPDMDRRQEAREECVCAYARGMWGEAEGADRRDESGAGGVEAAEGRQTLIEWTERSRPECSGWLRLRFGRSFAIMKLIEIYKGEY